MEIKITDIVTKFLHLIRSVVLEHLVTEKSIRFEAVWIGLCGFLFVPDFRGFLTTYVIFIDDILCITLPIINDNFQFQF